MLVAVLAVGCKPASKTLPVIVAKEQQKPLVIRHARQMNGGLMTIIAEHGVITAVLADDGPLDVPEDASVLDAAGRWLFPSFIDSHVHAVYDPRVVGYLDRGLAAVVDLGMPLKDMGWRAPGLSMKVAGPLITAPRGYPTQTWGKDGFGLELASPYDADRVVSDLLARGASVVMLAFAKPPSLDEATARVVVEAAHARGLKVAVYALTDATAALAATVGADILAHTPVEPLRPTTVAAWTGRAVISTLAAFGADKAALANIIALRNAGVTVLFGTDFGNATHVGINPREVSALLSAGFTMSAIIDAATRVPAQFWGFDKLGSIEVGKEASFFMTADHPDERSDALTVPIRVYVQGVEHRPGG